MLEETKDTSGSLVDHRVADEVVGRAGLQDGTGLTHGVVGLAPGEADVGDHHAQDAGLGRVEGVGQGSQGSMTSPA